MIERHWDGIAAYCRPENKIALGFVEGFNNKIPTRSEHPGRFKFELVNHILLAPFRQTAKEERMRREREKMLMSPRERTMRRRTRTLFVKTHEGGQVQSFVDTAQTPL